MGIITFETEPTLYAKLTCGSRAATKFDENSQLESSEEHKPC